MKEDTKSNEQTNEIDEFDNLFCQEEFPVLIRVPSLSELRDDLMQEQPEVENKSNSSSDILTTEGQQSLLVTEDEINNISGGGR